MDDFDRKICALVQRDNQRTHASIGAEIGLSEGAVRRRLKALRAQGVIERDVAILRQSEGGVRLIVTLSFGNESPESYQALDDQLAQLPEVLQSYHVSGSVDYVLIVQGPNVEWYEDWSKEHLMANPDIQRFTTHVVWSCKKFETAIPLTG
ncbi:MAG: Lrp/AsnC family transcriptional regulator [Pseudomonadota bacterium]